MDFKYDLEIANKKSFSRIFWGSGLIIAALLILLDALEIEILMVQNIPIGSMLLGFWLLCMTIHGIAVKKLHRVIFSLALIFLVFERHIAEAIGHPSDDIISGWAVFLIAFMLYVGLKLIFEPKKTVRERINDAVNVEVNGEKMKVGGRSTRYIDCVDFDTIYIENNAAKMDVYFSNTEHYKGNGTVKFENNAGSLTIHVPAEWRVVFDVENNAGVINDEKCINPNGKVLNIVGENNAAILRIKYCNDGAHDDAEVTADEDE